MKAQPARDRLLAAVFCLVGMACAVFAVVAQSRAQTPRRVFTVSVATAPAPIVAADDCPDNATCVVTAVPPAVVRTVLAAFPGVLTNDVAHAALSSRRPVPGEEMHRQTVDVRTRAGLRVSVVSRCVEQGSGVRAGQSATVPAAGPATVFAVVPGRSGCSVAVTLQVPAGVVVPWSAATTLAHRPELQLPG